MKKRLLSLFLVLVLVMILPVSVLAADALNIVEITGLTLPVEGATPDMSFGVIQSECTVEEVRWMDLSTDIYMSASDTFVYEKDEYGNERNYRLEVHISISDPYTVFADSDNIFVTINGVEAWASIIDDYHLIAEYDFVAAPHTCSGGYATCIEPANCSVCGKAYGSPNPENHDIFGYEKDSSHSKYTTHHDVKCDLCKKVFYEEEHCWGPENDKGIRPCIVCWYMPEPKPETHTCSGGYATCVEPAICSTCGKAYGSPNPDHHDIFGYEKDSSHSKYTTHHDVKCDLCKKFFYEEEHYWGPENDKGIRPCTVCWYTPDAPPASAGTSGVTRIYGSDRYATAIKAADALKEELGVSKFDCVVVASGVDFADALSGSYLANQRNAPILLVRNNTNTMNSVKDYIKKNVTPGATVYLLGGTNAVPAAMEKGLDGYTVRRLSGATRYDTNLAVLNECGVVSGSDILVCTGKDFADGLSASAVNKPVMLVKDSLTANQKNYLSAARGGSIYIIGGTNAVNTRIEAALASYGSVLRINGNTRYDTSVNIAKTFFKDTDSAVLVYGQNFPDGLAGGTLACSIDAPILLTSDAKRNIISGYTVSNGIKSGMVLGGTGLISDASAKNIFSVNTITVK